MKDLELEKAFEKVKNEDDFVMLLCFALAVTSVRCMYRLLEASGEAVEVAVGGEDHAK